MAEVSYKDLSLNGLWKNNPAIVQLLGLCPLLAVTGTVVNAIGLGLATIMVLVISNTSVSLIRGVVSDAVRLPAFVMIIAAAVTCIELLMQAYSYELYEILGIFLPLITTNCAILGLALFQTNRGYNFTQSVVYALGPAAGSGERPRRTAVLLGIEDPHSKAIVEASESGIRGATTIFNAEDVLGRVIANARLLPDPQITPPIPIGAACRLCERSDCAARSAPPITKPLGLDDLVQGFGAYGLT